MATASSLSGGGPDNNASRLLVEIAYDLHLPVTFGNIC